MLSLVGDTAGKVWNYLNENSESTLSNLKKELDLKGDSAALAIGWLAREGKVDLIKKGNSIKVKLID